MALSPLGSLESTFRKASGEGSEQSCLLSAVRTDSPGPPYCHDISRCNVHSGKGAHSPREASRQSLDEKLVDRYSPSVDLSQRATLSRRLLASSRLHRRRSPQRLEQLLSLISVHLVCSRRASFQASVRREAVLLQASSIKRKCKEDSLSRRRLASICQLLESNLETSRAITHNLKLRVRSSSAGIIEADLKAGA